jgi:NADPH:quinone reductase
LVHGLLGGVGALAAQLARWGGARVIGTVRRASDVESADVPGVAAVVPLDQQDPASAIRDLAEGGVDRVIEVAFSDNVDLDAAVARNNATIVAYATRADRPDFPFWPMLFDNVTIRLIGSDDFSPAWKQRAAHDLTDAARDGELAVKIGSPFPLDNVADAHERVDQGSRERVLVDLGH